MLIKKKAAKGVFWLTFFLFFMQKTRLRETLRQQNHFLGQIRG